MIDDLSKISYLAKKELSAMENAAVALAVVLVRKLKGLISPFFIALLNPMLSIGMSLKIA